MHKWAASMRSPVSRQLVYAGSLLVGCPLPGGLSSGLWPRFGVRWCRPFACTGVHSGAVVHSWCKKPHWRVLVYAGISSSSQLASASKRRPVGDQPASRGELHLPLAVSTPRPPSKPPFPSPHFHLNLVPLLGGIFSSYHSLR